jgi:hypothetical protein
MLDRESSDLKKRQRKKADRIVDSKTNDWY